MAESPEVTLAQLQQGSDFYKQLDAAGKAFADQIRADIEETGRTGVLPPQREGALTKSDEGSLKLGGTPEASSTVDPSFAEHLTPDQLQDFQVAGNIEASIAALSPGSTFHANLNFADQRFAASLIDDMQAQADVIKATAVDTVNATIERKAREAEAAAALKVQEEAALKAKEEAAATQLTADRAFFKAFREAPLSTQILLSQDPNNPTRRSFPTGFRINNGSLFSKTIADAGKSFQDSRTPQSDNVFFEDFLAATPAEQRALALSLDNPVEGVSFAPGFGLGSLVSNQAFAQRTKEAALKNRADVTAANTKTAFDDRAERIAARAAEEGEGDEFSFTVPTLGVLGQPLGDTPLVEDADRQAPATSQQGSRNRPAFGVGTASNPSSLVGVSGGGGSGLRIAF